MITFTTNDAGPLTLHMRMESPAVYLDHWAVRMISEDEGLSSRFRAALERRRGTLCISWVNLAEFVKLEHEDSVLQADEFLELVFPRLFFLEADPWQVIQAEDDLLSGKRRAVAPHGDWGLLRVLADLEPKGLLPVTVSGLIRSVRAGGSLDERFNQMSNVFVERVTHLREVHGKDPAFAEQVSKVAKGSRIPAATRFLLREILKPLLTNKKTAISANDAMDFYHSVVPVSYCGFVLLDGRWAAQARQAVSRLQRAGHHAEMARVFSGKRNGLSDFLTCLEDVDGVA